MSRAYNFKYIKIGADGISFDYQGHEVIWVFPWKRKHFGSKFYSLLMDDHYGSLEEIDEDIADFVYGRKIN